MASGAPPFCRCGYGTGPVRPVGRPGCHAPLLVAARKGGGWVQAAPQHGSVPWKAGKPRHRGRKGI